MRILIADDSNDMRLLLSRLLQKWGHEVVAARDGLEAWHIIQQEEVSFLITDWMALSCAKGFDPQFFRDTSILFY